MQLNYNQSFQPAVAGGLIYPFEENTILTYSNPTEQIQWGRGVVLHTFGGGGGGGGRKCYWGSWVSHWICRLRGFRRDHCSFHRYRCDRC